MHILLGSNIVTEDIDAAHELLELFYNLMPQLYPEEMLSPNLHSVIHLSICVHDLGPLWAYSCFGFENMNGYIKLHRHGCKNFLPSLVHAITMKYCVSNFVKQLSKTERPEVLQFFAAEKEGHEGP